MDERTRNLIQRSIDSKHINWQIHLLNSRYNTKQFSKFKSVFKEKDLDYRAVHNKLYKLWLEIKADDFLELKNFMWSSSFDKYNLKYSEEMVESTKKVIESDLDFELVERIFGYIEVIKKNKEPKKGKQVSEFIEFFKKINDDLEEHHPQWHVDHGTTSSSDEETEEKNDKKSKDDQNESIEGGSRQTNHKAQSLYDIDDFDEEDSEISSKSHSLASISSKSTTKSTQKSKESLPNSDQKNQEKKKKKKKKKKSKKHYNILLEKVPKLEFTLTKIPFSLTILFFTSLTRCHSFRTVLSAFERSEINPLAFLNAWFQNFFLYNKTFIKSQLDINLMNHKQIRRLRKNIAAEKEQLRHGESIFDMAWQGNNERVLFLLQSGGEINARNDLKRHTAILHIAAEKNNLELIDIAMRYGADLNIRDRLLRTPLFFAAEKNNYEALEKLIGLGADVNALDRKNSPLMYWAMNSGDLRTLKIIKEAGADLDLFCGEMRRPLFKAAYLDKPDVLGWLLTIPRVARDLHLVDHRLRSALHAACIGDGAGHKGKVINGKIITDSPECMQMLLNAGANVKIKIFLFFSIFNFFNIFVIFSSL